METDPNELHPQTYNWTAVVLSKKTVKKIYPGDLIRELQPGLCGWSSYSVIIDVFEYGDIKSISKYFRTGQLVQVAHPHQRSK